MSGIGFSELIILFLIGLIVLGPERLPRVANQLGGWLGQARRMTRVMKRQLEEELNLEKDLSINPQQSVERPSYVTPANQTSDLSDTYSPAHEEDEAGTGVKDDDSADVDAERTADKQAIEDDIENRRFGYAGAVRHLLRTAVKNGEVEETLAWISDEAPGIFEAICRRGETREILITANQCSLRVDVVNHRS